MFIVEFDPTLNKDYLILYFLILPDMLWRQQISMTPSMFQSKSEHAAVSRRGSDYWSKLIHNHTGDDICLQHWLRWWFVEGIKSLPVAHFTNDFSIVIQIRWKFHVAFIPIVAKWSLRHSAFGTAATLSRHAQKFVAIWYFAMELY